MPCNDRVDSPSKCHAGRKEKEPHDLKSSATEVLRNRCRWSRLALPLVLALLIGAVIGFIIGALVLKGEEEQNAVAQSPIFDTNL